MFAHLRKTHSKLIIFLGIIFILCLLPLKVKSPYIFDILILIAIRSILASSWDVSYGYMGVFHFAQIAFMGIGAYASALISMHLQVPPFFCILLGGLFSAIASLIISLPTLRARGVYLSLLSMGFALMAYHIISSWTNFTRGLLCLYGIEPLFGGISPVPYYYTAIGLLTFSTVLLYIIIKSRYGLSIMAINSSAKSASSLGVEILKTKIIILAITAGLAGMAGGFYAHYRTMLAPTVLDISAMIDMMIMAVFGGLGSIFGPIIGAAIITTSMEYLRFIQEYRFILYSIVIILIMIFKPKGFYGLMSDLIAWIRSKMAKQKKGDDGGKPLAAEPGV